MANRRRGIIKSVHSKEQRVFCDLMVEARNNADLSQAKLAKRLKRPQSFVAKYEGGERRLDIVEFVAIAEALGADPVEILRVFMRRTV